MKRFSAIAFILLIFLAQTQAQLVRSDEFHKKYTLAEVVVFSRHNIRAPLSRSSSIMTQITPYKWHSFGVPTQDLTMKGGVLETINGQFFHQWLVKEGLFAEDAVPTDEEVYFLANSKQRTIATARYFASGFMPMQTFKVNHVGKIGDSDPNFSMNLNSDLTKSDWKQIKHEYDSICANNYCFNYCKALKPSFDLLSDVIDMKDSKAYKDGSFKGFNNYNSQILYGSGKEPVIDGSLNDASNVADALVLQYYEDPDSMAASFGKKLTNNQWKIIAKLIHDRDALRFSSPFVQRYVSKHQRELLAEELQKKDRKFFYMCGHDTNILNILAALKVVPYDLPEAIESGTPIGTKIVFEKWKDADGKEYVAVNHVYQTLSELRHNTMLNDTVRPCVIPLQFVGMTQNADGLYTLEDMLNRLTLK